MNVSRRLIFQLYKSTRVLIIFENQGWGSTHIMPPEVLLSRCRYNGPEVDVWSIGVILFWSVVGVHPFAKVLHIGYEEIGNDVLVRGAYPKLNAKEIILFDDLIESSRIQLSQKEIDQISPGKSFRFKFSLTIIKSLIDSH